MLLTCITTEKTMIQYIATTKEWSDKVNGNSYFSSQILDTKIPNQIIKLPFQYGYGSQSEYEIKKELNLPKARSIFDDRIKFIKIDGCLKKEVIEWGEQ